MASGAPQWTHSAYVGALDTVSAPRRIALVAGDGVTDAPVGFVVANLMPPEATLESIAVIPDRQRRGLGGRLLRALRGELPAQGVTELLLEVRASNSGAIGLYEEQGFTRIGQRRGYYSDPEEDAIVMRLGLAS